MTEVKDTRDRAGCWLIVIALLLVLASLPLYICVLIFVELLAMDPMLSSDWLYNSSSAIACVSTLFLWVIAGVLFLYAAKRG